MYKVTTAVVAVDSLASTGITDITSQVNLQVTWDNAEAVYVISIGSGLTGEVQLVGSLNHSYMGNPDATAGSILVVTPKLGDYPATYLNSGGTKPNSNPTDDGGGKALTIVGHSTYGYAFLFGLKDLTGTGTIYYGLGYGASPTCEYFKFEVNKPAFTTAT